MSCTTVIDGQIPSKAGEARAWTPPADNMQEEPPPTNSTRRERATDRKRADAALAQEMGMKGGVEFQMLARKSIPESLEKVGRLE